MKIAIWTYTKWAFGQVHRAIAKYSKHQVNLIDWGIRWRADTFKDYDLIHIPTLENYHTFIRGYPNLKHKACCSIRGKAELWNYDPFSWTRHTTSAEIIDTGILPGGVVSFINETPKIACINKELIDLIQCQTNASVASVQIGVDKDIFWKPISKDSNRLRVICPTARADVFKSEHCYNVKRWNLVLEIEKQLPNVDFVFYEKRLSIDDIANFYAQGDIILCLSHSEGNPLGPMEAAMGGVLPIVTPVGCMPEVFKNGHDAFILHALDDASVVEECVARIKELDTNRERLRQMRIEAQNTIVGTRSWEQVIGSWDSFFGAVDTPVVAEPSFPGFDVQKKFRFHLLGLSHLPTSRKYNACAFTQKNVKLAKMLVEAGHEVFLYGAKTTDGPQPVCTEFVPTHTVADIANDYGDGDSNFEIGYDWKSSEFRHDINASKKPSTIKYYENCISEINKRKRPDDFLLITQGRYQEPIDKGVNLKLTCEPGIGYRGSYCKYRAFESSYIQNFTYGSQHPFKSINGNYWDRVIPNYFDSEDVEFGEGLGGYYLYIGRMISRKGVTTAVKTCNHLGIKLLLVGQGGHVDDNHVFHGDDFNLQPGTWEYFGYADFESRKKLFANAIATFVPTIYLEPFAGTHIESMLSGTPVITTDFGVFPGTVINGVNGYRCHVLQDFVDAAIKCRSLDRSVVRATAQPYLCENVIKDYNKWFSELHNLYESMDDPKKLAWHRLGPNNE
jgi:glycosyltransferase involved in cell wall biosynthesis